MNSGTLKVNLDIQKVNSHSQSALGHLESELGHSESDTQEVKWIHSDIVELVQL